MNWDSLASCIEQGSLGETLNWLLKYKSKTNIEKQNLLSLPRFQRQSRIVFFFFHFLLFKLVSIRTLHDIVS